MKSRLTITLSKDVLKKVDRTIDGEDIRNRSHAIEHLISKGFAPKVTTAVILAGGKKTSKILPPLTKVNGKCLISTMIDHLVKHGIKRVLVCPGNHEEQIKKELGTGSRFGVEIIYIQEEKSLGTAGILKRIKRYVPRESFMVVHGDVLTDIHLKSFIKFHEEEGGTATIAVKPRISERKFGKAILQGNKITKFDYKGGEKGISIVNTGIYLFTPEIFNEIPNKTPSTLEKQVFPKLAKKNKLSAFLFQGIWYDISRKGTLNEAKKRWRNRV